MKRLELGAEIHGDNNWRGGGPEFEKECLRHLIEHVLNLIEGDTSDDHIGAILCNAGFLAYFDEARRNQPMHGRTGDDSDSVQES